MRPIGPFADGYTQTPRHIHLPMMTLSAHTDVFTYGDGAHTERDTRAGQGAKSGTEATHEHARTHRHARSTKTHSDPIHPEGQTHEDTQTARKAYTDNSKQQACSGTHRHRDAYTQRSINRHLYPEVGACTHPAYKIRCI